MQSGSITRNVFKRQTILGNSSPFAVCSSSAAKVYWFNSRSRSTVHDVGAGNPKMGNWGAWTCIRDESSWTGPGTWLAPCWATDAAWVAGWSLCPRPLSPAVPLALSSKMGILIARKPTLQQWTSTLTNVTSFFQHMIRLLGYDLYSNNGQFYRNAKTTLLVFAAYTTLRLINITERAFCALQSLRRLNVVNNMLMQSRQH